MLETADSREKLKAAEVALSTMAALFVLILGGRLWWLMAFDSAPPVTSTWVQTRNAQGVPQTVFSPGEVMLVARDLCFTRDVPVRFGRKLRSVDAPYLNIDVDSTNAYVKRGCVPNANVVKIPDKTPPGRRYEFSVIVQYANNSFREDAVELPVPVIEVR